jgi:membrane protease YdiL (CAAX protease family)
MSGFTDDEGRLRPGWAFLLSSVLCCIAFAVAGFSAAEIAGDHVLRFELVFRTLLAILLLAVFTWLLAVGNHIETHRLAAQGLPVATGWAKQFVVGGVIASLLVLTAVIPIAIWGNLTFRFTFGWHSNTRIPAVLFVLLVGALAEELMFRGYPFQRLVEAIGATGAIAVFSVLFAAMHLWNPAATVWGLVNTIAIGIAFAVAYLRTRALWLPWGFHFAWNSTMGLVLGLPVSGIRVFNVAIHANAAGPAWLTGGKYGIESSAPGTFAVVLGLFILCNLPLKPLGAGTGILPEETPPPPFVTDSSN